MCKRKASSTMIGEQTMTDNPFPPWLKTYRHHLGGGQTAAVQIDFQQIDYSKLTNSQKFDINIQLVEAIASTLAYGGLTAHVQNLKNTRGSVTLSKLDQTITNHKHALVVDCRVTLPLDVSIHDARMNLASDASRQKLADAISHVDGMQDIDAGRPAVAVGMSGKDMFLKLDRFHK